MRRCSPPKSISIMALTAGDERIVPAHQAACRVTIAELEKAAATRVRQGRQRALRATGEIAAAAFRHDASRALDPQLHTHVVVFNATWEPKLREMTSQDIIRWQRGQLKPEEVQVLEQVRDEARRSSSLRPAEPTAKVIQEEAEQKQSERAEQNVLGTEGVEVGPKEGLRQEQTKEEPHAAGSGESTCPVEEVEPKEEQVREVERVQDDAPGPQGAAGAAESETKPAEPVTAAGSTEENAEGEEELRQGTRLGEEIDSGPGPEAAPVSAEPRQTVYEEAQVAAPNTPSPLAYEAIEYARAHLLSASGSKRPGIWVAKTPSRKRIGPCNGPRPSAGISWATALAWS